jgi:hypothetical protein
VQFLLLPLLKLSIASAIAVSVLAPQNSCSSKGGSCSRDNGGTLPTTVTTGSIDVNLNGGQITASEACVHAGNSPGGNCTVESMSMGTFIDGGDNPNGQLECKEIHNVVRNYGTPTTRSICHQNYSASIPGIGNGEKSGALIVCAKVKCPEDVVPRNVQAVAWAGKAMKPPDENKDLCRCFEPAATATTQSGPSAGGATVPLSYAQDWLNEPIGTTFNAGLSFHIRSQPVGQIIQSCVVRTEATQKIFEVSSHAGSGAAFATLSVYDGALLAEPHLVALPVAANGRPTGSLEFPTSINGKKLVLQLYSGAMEALGGYEVDLGSSY